MSNHDYHRPLWIVAATVAISVTACALRPSGPDTRASLPDSAYGNDRLARELRPAGEFPLYRLGADSLIVAFRMVSLGAWGGASIMRLEQRNDTWQFVVKATDNGTPRRLMVGDSANVANAQADSLIAALATSRYWTQPTQRCRVGLDGYRIILEARIRAEYFTIDCRVPEESGAPAVLQSMRAFETLSTSALPAPGVRAP
jgi:hypothetical protein